MRKSRDKLAGPRPKYTVHANGHSIACSICWGGAGVGSLAAEILLDSHSVLYLSSFSSCKSVLGVSSVYGLCGPPSWFLRLNFFHVCIFAHGKVFYDWSCSSVGRVLAQHAWSPALHKNNTMVHACDPRIQEAETWGSEFQGHPRLHRKIEASLRNIFKWKYGVHIVY